ncbi:flagellin [Cupriavidus numazuensis]|uniref:Flagellin n=1 Tax=Cupriavidus numazuensis TaxID=221992 RepID=A0ABN7PVI6_9BURK|nr:flagellin [Cupriavidus numazuensis]CAG2141664.1 hypothetical protein LMG26411_02099 [Cupriavidus numazuensis]
MVQTSVKTTAPCLNRAGSATAVVLLGMGMAYASGAHANEQPLPDALDAAAVPAQAALSAQEAKEDKPLAAVTRGSMAGWKPVTEDRLDEMRGGFDVGGLQVSFGIERAVFVNGALAVATSITIPDVARITSEQAAKLAATLGPAIVSSTQADVNSALAGNPTTAGVQLGSNGASGGNGSSSSASSAAAGSSASSAGSASSVTGNTGAPGMPSTVITTATGQVVTNGLLSVIQNGPGNAAAVGTQAGTPLTVIQNTLNNQSIQSLMTIDASVNTLQAFRAQVTNATLNNVLMRAASMR